MQDDSSQESGPAFGSWLRDLRRARRLSRPQLAGLVGCATVTLEKIEDGTRRASLQIATLLATQLAIPVELQPLFRLAARGEVPAVPSQLLALTRPVATSEPAAAAHGNLPVPASSFVGRADELRLAAAMLSDPQIRLLSVLGPGGVGKTRLAIRLGEAAGAQFAGGVYFVGLALLQEAAAVLPAIARALELAPSGSEPLLQGVQRRLQAKRTLLILDNFEHLLAATAVVSALLAACPQLKVVVSSREALRLGGEHEFVLGPLSLAPPESSVEAASAGQFDSMRLFIERARQIDPAFTLNSANVALIAAICRRLDGLPLGIELAAAQLRVLAPGQLLERLTDLLSLPIEGGADQPARQLSLGATLDWSYSLLDEAEKRLFRRLSVFAGGADLAAASAVCGDAGVPEGTTLRGIGALLRKSLLYRSAAGTVRCAMLQLTREYARKKLAGSGESAALRQRHAEYFLHLAERAKPGLEGPAQQHWLDLIEVEHANISAALGWWHEQGDGATVLRLTHAIYNYWRVRSRHDEAISWYKRGLALGAQHGDSHAPTRAAVIDALGWLNLYRTDYRTARRYFEQSRALWRRSSDKAGLANTLTGLGWIEQAAHNLPGAETCFKEALALRQDLGDLGGIANALNWLGVIACDKQDYDGSIGYHAEALQLARQLGDRGRMSFALIRMGMTQLVAGRFDLASAYLTQSLDLLTQLGDVGGICLAADQLALTTFYQGDYARAEGLARQALRLNWEHGKHLAVIYQLGFFIRLAYRSGYLQLAAWLLGHHSLLPEREAIQKTDNEQYQRELAELEKQVQASTELTRAYISGQTADIGAVVDRLLGARLLTALPPAQC